VTLSHPLPTRSRRGSRPRAAQLIVRLALCALAALGVPALAPASAGAQQGDPEARLAKLDPASRRQVEALFDSAARAQLSPDVLVMKTLEGISKGKPGAQIVTVVRRYFEALKQARTALGDSVRRDELVAAAGAVQAGVKPSAIAKLRSSRAGREITVPLVVLGDLVSRGVPTDDASSAIIRLTQGGALDSDFRGLWRGVEQDIVSGVPPAAALDRRAREIPGHASPGGRLPAAPTSRQPEVPSS
jgi:hypothetical protein